MPQAKKKSRRGMALGVIIAAAALALASLGFFLYQKLSNKDGDVSYREMEVERGDLTSGITESGSTSLTSNAISCNIQLTSIDNLYVKIEELYVKSGYEVLKGDPLIKLTADSISDAIADVELKLKQAQLTLEEQKANQTAKLSDAEQTLKSNLNLKKTAADTKSASVESASNSVLTAELNLSNAQSDLEKYEALLESYAADTDYLEQLKGWSEEAKQRLADYEKQAITQSDNTEEQLDEITTRKSAFESAEKSLKSAQEALQYAQLNRYNSAELQAAYASGDDDEVELVIASLENAIISAQENVQKAQYNYQIAQNEYAQVYSDKTYLDSVDKNIESEVAQYEAEYNNFNTAYTDYKTYYDERYTLKGTALSDKVEQLRKDIEKYELALQVANTNAKLTSASAAEKLESSLATANVAQSKYDATVMQINNAVDSQQLEVDEYARQLEVLNESFPSDGVLTAPCDGVVASINYAVGDSVFANNSMMSVIDSQYVYLTVSLSEEDINSVSIGQLAQVTLSSYEDEVFTAEVDSITVEPARSSSATASYTVTVKLDDEYIDKVYTGMNGEVTFIEDQVKDVIYISKQAIQTEGKESYVLVKGADGKPVKTIVETGFTDGRYVEIKSGLSENDTVLLSMGGNASATAKSSSEKKNSGSGDTVRMGESPAGEAPANGPGGQGGGRPE